MALFWFSGIPGRRSKASVLEVSGVQIMMLCLQLGMHIGGEGKCPASEGSNGAESKALSYYEPHLSV